MTYQIIEDCVKYGCCYYESLNDAIVEGEDSYFIIPERCNECGSCMENNYCPAWAIHKV